jgi:rare lipoprotein A
MTRIPAFFLSFILVLHPAVAGTGLASYYATGKRTANGEFFDPRGLTAAHRICPSAQS